MKENDSQMGLSGSGKFNSQGNQLTNFLGISNSMDILGGKFFGSFYWGLTADNNLSEKEMGMISSINNIRSSSFGLGYLTGSVFQKNDLIIPSISQSE